MPQNRIINTEVLSKKQDVFDLVHDKILITNDRSGYLDLQYLLPLSRLINLSGGAGIYELSSPTTVTVGGLPAGSDIFGLPIDVILERILVPPLNPTFTSFNISGQSTLIEVGETLAGSKNFVWSTSNSQNVTANSVSILDVTAGVTLQSGLANDGNESIDIGVVNTSAPFTQSYRATAINSNNGNVFQSGLFTVTGIYPFFFGTSATPPVANQALLNSGSKTVSSSQGTLNIDFNATIEYLWFAIPSSSPTKTRWFVDTLNNGDIGGPTNLFNNAVTVSVNSPSGLWSSVNYDFYISNFATTTTTNSTPIMQIRN